MRKKIINNLSIRIQYHVIQIDFCTNRNHLNPVLQLAPTEEFDNMIDS